jgi:hypothetical protein
MKPINTGSPRSGSSSRRGKAACMPAAASPSKALTEQQQQQHSAGGVFTSSSSSSACGSPAVLGGQGEQQAKQHQPHPFGQADAAGKELQGEFPVLHTTYSTDGGVSVASGISAGSGSLRLNALNSSNGLTSLTSEASTSSAQAGKGGDWMPKSARGGQRRTGVPDYKSMHEKWEAQQAAKKAANTKRVTVPEVCASKAAETASYTGRVAAISSSSNLLLLWPHCLWSDSKTRWVPN